MTEDHYYLTVDCLGIKQHQTNQTMKYKFNAGNLILCAICLLVFSSCPPPPVDVSVTVYEGNLPLNNAEVILSTRSETMLKEATSLLGTSFFKVARRDVGREAIIRIVQPLMAVDTSFRVTLRVNNEIRLTAAPSNIADPASYGKSLQAQQELEGIEDNLNGIKQAMDAVNRRLEEYEKKYPNTALKGYKAILATRRKELELLKGRTRNLVERYAQAIDSLEGGYQIDIARLQRKRNEILLHNKDFMKIWNSSEVSLAANIDAGVDRMIEFNILFSPGKFKREHLNTSQASALNQYAKNLKTTILEVDRFDSEGVKLILDLVGYADGTDVHDARAINKACDGKHDNHRHIDKNYCLSYLRAKTIGLYLKEGLPKDVKIVMEDTYDGKGREDAPVNTDDPDDRRCKTSFAVIPFSIIDQQQY